MKNFSLVFLICLLTYSLEATVLVVDNNPGSTAQYTTIISAINAAAPGDTIYVQGSTIDYSGNCLHNINKKIILLGPGHKPANQTNLNARITGCGPAISLITGATGTVIMGFWLSGSIWATTGTVDSLVITNNYITDNIDISGNDHVIANNVIQGTNPGIDLNGGGGTNIFIRNNIIAGRIQDFNSPTVEISNNVFIINAAAFQAVSNSFVRNNIFLKANPSGISNATFLNNITYLTTDTVPNGTSTGSGNINNTDPQFINVSSAATQFSYSYNYQLQNTSPGKNAGTDGTDIGVFGGLTPFKPGGETFLPVIRQMTITNPIVPSGTDINVTITAETQE